MNDSESRMHGYFDAKHRKLVRDLEDAQRTRKLCRRILWGWTLAFLTCVAACIGAGLVAAIGTPCLPAALGWTGGVLGVALTILAGLAMFIILEDVNADSTPWTAVRDAERALNDHLEELVS